MHAPFLLALDYMNSLCMACCASHSTQQSNDFLYMPTPSRYGIYLTPLLCGLEAWWQRCGAVRCDARTVNQSNLTQSNPIHPNPCVSSHLLIYAPFQAQPAALPCPALPQLNCIVPYLNKGTAL
mmetsp:Transcript_2938/g.4474  ORF Transcript_2938/g.4474 Transcript_2938/m.4474 type:complete len:124 (+) Transcript_2938:328-699(+)